MATQDKPVSPDITQLRQLQVSSFRQMCYLLTFRIRAMLVMPETATTSAHSVATADGLLVEKFSSTEALNELYAANGWESDYRQIEPGELEITVTGRAVGDVEFFREQFSRRITSSTKSPCEIFSFVLAAHGELGRIQGRRLGLGDLLLAPPCSRLDIVPTAGCDVLTIHIPAARFADYAAALGADESLDLESGPTWYSSPSTNIDSIRQLALAMLAPSATLPEAEGIDWTLISSLLGFLSGEESSHEQRDPYGRASKHRIVERARKYVDIHLAEDIRIANLCEHCGVSLSTLERMFRRELDIAPKDYIVAARLATVRRKLWDDDYQSLSIAAVAMDSGFTHMSRFSQQYRHHFGHLPSEDRDVGKELIDKYREK